MTLFWHGHFATSAVKVRDAYLMWRQNDLFRRHGLGPWRTLLREVTLDPAMLSQQSPNDSGGNMISRRKSLKKSLRESFRKLRRGRSQKNPGGRAG